MKLENGRRFFYQWEQGQRLIVDLPCTMVQFANGTTENALGCEVIEENGVRYVDVPNILLQTAAKLHAYAWDEETTSVVGHRVFDVEPMPKPEGYAYTETEVKRYDMLLKELEEKTAYYVPEVDAEGNLSWRKSMESLPDVPGENIRGPAGPQGPQGEQGERGPQGVQGEKGDKGDKGDAEGAVLYLTQTLTPEQQAQARENIGAASEETIGDIEAALDSILAIQKELIGVKLITFTVDDKTYQAEEGMTWADWIASEYNSEMITCPDCGKTVKRWVDYDGTPTYIDETVSCLGPDCTGYPAPYVCVYNSEEEIAERRPDVIPDTTDLIDPGLIYGFDRDM